MAGSTAALFGSEFGVFGAGSAAAGVASGVGVAAGVASVAGQLGAFGRRGPIIPPQPQMTPQQVDASTQAAEANAMHRESIAGGIESTIGTAGGAAGELLNPQISGTKQLLGQ